MDGLMIPSAIAMIIMLLVGGFFGLLGMAVACGGRAQSLAAAVLLIPVFVLVDFLLQQGLAGHAIQFVAVTWIARVVLRARESSGGARPAESPIGATPTAPQV
jgi:hypothetical protein